MHTLGWIIGCWIISGLGADRSTHAGYTASVTWLAVACFTFFLPPLEVRFQVSALPWWQWLVNAMTLLKNPDHRVVFFTVALVAIPIAAFYPFTPPNMRELGLKHTTAWMSLGQVTELVGMFSLGALMTRWRLKWIFVLGLGFTVLRFVFCAVGTKACLLVGTFLHGASFVPVYVTAQIYFRIPRRRCLMRESSGVAHTPEQRPGKHAGLSRRRLRSAACTGASGTRWTLFWNGLAVASAAVLIYFLATYRGRTREVKAPAV